MNWGAESSNGELGSGEVSQRYADESNSPVKEIKNPKYYSRWKIQPIEFILKNDLPAWMANIIKYIMRYDDKDGLKDLYKARDYLNMKIAELEGKDKYWEIKE